MRTGAGRGVALVGLMLGLALGTGCATRSGSRGSEGRSTAKGSASAASAPASGYGKASTGDLPVEVVRWGDLAHELAAALKREGSTCAGVARAVGGHVDRHGRELGATQKALLAWEKSTPKWRVREYYRGVFPQLEVRIDAGVRCKGDGAARKAFDRFFDVMGLDGRG
ncbi:MAG: hypothetical protein JNJ59_16520 [Deltaproteobacteria bacterium]|nr:hypothetical protein [Deltaproteobacteria bacterium]